MAKVATAKPLRGMAPIELGGEVRHLRYSFNALERIEEAFGLNLFDGGLEEVASNLSIKKLRFLVWQGLLHEQPDLTEEEVGEWLDFTNVPDITQAFLAAFGMSMPEPPEQEQAGDGEKK